MVFFEGTEKRLELDFVGSGDLRTVDRSAWEEVVRLAATQILNMKSTDTFTSFLLSESSLIVYKDKVILKTCGQTVPLSSVSEIMTIASKVGLEKEWMSYSRKNFLAPNFQPELHQCHHREAELCRQVCDGVGNAYVLGPITGEHWVLYDADFLNPDCSSRGDLTVDIMMYGLPADVRQLFYTDLPEGSREGAEKMTRESGLSEVAAMIERDAEIDDYCFDTCGYSCNAHAGQSYFMVHVTPQEECSYASFETNFGTTFQASPQGDMSAPLNALVERVLAAFRPERLTMTCFADLGAVNALSGAPFRSATQQYRRVNLNS